ncbi:hypothetical protein Ddye_022668 [Dipteronia dyeriana]|uniref:Uncharacterized protein n=1 Tax=Dipteronia dyeriana TaxID=168575 RepID=A0AAD9WSL4_9ROSI|nr:hypothetical protein Ddye_022668 [Dipteronia dyeriana]
MHTHQMSEHQGKVKDCKMNPYRIKADLEDPNENLMEEDIEDHEESKEKEQTEFLLLCVKSRTWEILPLSSVVGASPCIWYVERDKTTWDYFFLPQELRMDRNAFAIFCDLLKTCGGLLVDFNVTKEEQVVTFVNILAHRNKNRSIQGCLGALDRTYIEVTAPEYDKPRYQTRKGHIATNVLGACTRDLKFEYVLSGWEGSAQTRVLRDAITRHNGLNVLFGKGIPTVKVFLYHIEVQGNFDMFDRHNCTLEEDNVIISIIEEIVADSDRCDNGSFRAGAYEQVVSKMREKN